MTTDALGAGRAVGVDIAGLAASALFIADNKGTGKVTPTFPALAFIVSERRADMSVVELILTVSTKITELRVRALGTRTTGALRAVGVNGAGLGGDALILHAAFVHRAVAVRTTRLAAIAVLCAYEACEHKPTITALTFVIKKARVTERVGGLAIPANVAPVRAEAVGARANAVRVAGAGMLATAVRAIEPIAFSAEAGRAKA